MVRPYFIFKNVNCIELGIYISQMPPEQYPIDEIEFIEVPGRDGYLTINKGRKLPITKVIEATLLKKENREIVRRWLTGEGELILSTEPEAYYKARIVEPVEFVGTIRRGRKFKVEFLCQPWAYLLTGKNKIIITQKNTIINNPGEIAKPLIKIYGNGPVDLIVNNKIHKFDDINEYAIVDSELMEVYKDISLVRYYGDFPELQPGENIISWTGDVTKIEIIPRWRR